MKQLTEPCITHFYNDLPMKGFAHSFDGVGVGEPVIIPMSAGLDEIIWDYTEAEIERRAADLGAEVIWMELPQMSASSEVKYKMWFSKQ